MKTLLGFMLTLALVALPALAGDEAMIQPAANDVQLGTLHALNNVYTVKDGHQTALCGCGKEFEVTEATPKMDANGMTFYCCSQECHEHAMKSTPEEMAAGMKEWQKAFSGKEMLSNAMLTDGKQMATCACGQTFEVNANSPCVVENGMKMSACCGGCAEHVMKAAPEERGAMMKKVMKTASLEAKQ